MTKKLNKKDRKQAQEVIADTFDLFSERYDNDPDFRAYVNTMPGLGSSNVEREFHDNFWLTLKGEEWLEEAKSL